MQNLKSVLVLLLVFSTPFLLACNTESWESGYDGWVLQDLSSPFYPATIGPAQTNPSGFSFFNPQPTDGTMSFFHGFDASTPGNLTLTKTVTMETQLTFDYRYAWDLVSFCSGNCLARYFIINFYSTSDVLLQSTQVLVSNLTVLYDSGIMSANIDTSALSGSSIKVQFVWTVPQSSSGPAFFELDNIQFCVPPSPSATPTASATPSATPSVTPTASVTPSATPSVTPTVTPTASVTPSATPSVTPTASVTPSSTPSVTPTASATPSVTPSASASMTPSTTPSVSPSVTPSPSFVPSEDKTATSKKAGLIAGLVIGIPCALGISGVIILLLLKRRKSKSPPAASNEMELPKVQQKDVENGKEGQKDSSPEATEEATTADKSLGSSSSVSSDSNESESD